MRYFFLGIVTALLFLWGNLVVWGGEYFDQKCIKGRLTYQHVKTINEVGWSKHPVKENDRIIDCKCSRILRAMHLRDLSWWIPYREKIQAYLFGEKIK